MAVQHDVVDEATAIAAAAAAKAHMPTHSWWYGDLSELLDRVRSHGTPPPRKHCGCLGCRNGFSHVPAVSR